MSTVQSTGSFLPVQSAIQQAAARTDTDFSYLLAQAKIESGLDAGAKARTSSAAGLYQFIGQTWLETVQRHGEKHGMSWAANAIETVGGRATVRDPNLRTQIMELRFDPEAAALMAGEYAQENGAYLGSTIGRQPDNVELYLAHFLGPKGAETFIREHGRNPAQPAAALFGQAAGANRSIFYEHGRSRSLGEVRTLFAAKLDAAGTSSPASAGGPGFAHASYTPRRYTPSGAFAPVQPGHRRPMAEVLSGSLRIGSGHRSQ